jgi:homoserine dehydrogenase
MAKLKIGICGWGNVATGLYEELVNGAEIYNDWEICCIGARRDNPKCNPGSTKILRDIFEVVEEDIDVLVELIGGVETAKDLIERALNAGKHVVTANKAVIFEHGEELINTAIKNNVELLFESAVCAGTPSIKMLSNDLTANKISKVAGMLNGTTNFILSNMEEGASYEAVLQEAQEKGYAEPDPSLDVNGTDAAHKIGILSALAFNTGLPAPSFYVEGIEN